MEFKKEKGFTLIELLAVIVILTLIMLIVTPLILKIIQDARKEAFRASAYGIMKSAEFKTERKILNGEQGDFISIYEDKVLSEGEKLDFKGTKPKRGAVVVSNGKVSLVITNGVWCARKGYNDTKITLTKYPEEDNCELWEIIDAEITVEGDAVIKLRSLNNDIKYLVSNELRDFGPSYWVDDDVYVSKPIQFLDNEFINKKNLYNEISIIKFGYGFFLTERGLIDIFNELQWVIKGKDIKDFGFDFINERLVILFNCGSLKSYDYETYELMEEIADNIKEIFAEGYLTEDNDIISYEGISLVTGVDRFIGEIWYEDENYQSVPGYIYLKGNQLKLLKDENDDVNINGLNTDIEILDKYIIVDKENNFYKLYMDEDGVIEIEKQFFMCEDSIFNSNIKEICFNYILAYDGRIYEIKWGENNEAQLEEVSISEKGVTFLYDLPIPCIELETGSYYELEEKFYIDLVSMLSMFLEFRNDAREILEEVVDIFNKDIYIDVNNKIKIYNDYIEEYEMLDLNYNEIGKPYKILTGYYNYSENPPHCFSIDIINENNNIYNIDLEGNIDGDYVIENLGVINVDGVVKVINSFAGYYNGEFIIVDNSGKVHNVFFDSSISEYSIETLNEDNDIFVVDLITPEIYVDRDGYLYGYFYNYSEEEDEWFKLELDLEDGELYELDESHSENTISQFKDALPLVLRDDNDVLYTKTYDDRDRYSIENQFENIGIKKIVAIDTCNWGRAWYIIVIDNNNDVWGFLQVTSDHAS